MLAKWFRWIWFRKKIVYFFFGQHLVWAFCQCFINLFGWIHLIAIHLYFCFFFFIGHFWWLQFMPYLLRCEPFWAIALTHSIYSFHFRSVQHQIVLHNSIAQKYLFSRGLTKWWSRDCVHSGYFLFLLLLTLLLLAYVWFGFHFTPIMNTLPSTAIAKKKMKIENQLRIAKQKRTISIKQKVKIFTHSYNNTDMAYGVGRWSLTV